ncbi:MAG: hypothetical protein ABIH39_08155 [Candidatus Margulisiibacteriota bacterium]
MNNHIERHNNNLPEYKMEKDYAKHFEDEILKNLEQMRESKGRDAKEEIEELRKKLL